MCLNLKNIYLVIFVMNQLCEKKMTFKTFFVCVCGWDVPKFLSPEYLVFALCHTI